VQYGRAQRVAAEADDAGDERGLQRVERIFGERVYEFWTPDIDRLSDTTRRS
jgi:hypothetical protein